MSLVSARIERSIRVGTDFGGALRESRQAVGMSAARVAAELGVRLSQVHEWERGDAVPTQAAVRALARLLDLGASTARAWLEWTGADPVSLAESPEVEIVLLGSDAPADPFTAPTVVVDLTHSEPSRLEAARFPAGVPGGAAVFPAPGSGTYVYSDAGFESPQQARPMTRRRWLVTAAVLVVLAVVLWWAFGELGHGLASLVDRVSVAPG